MEPWLRIRMDISYLDNSLDPSVYFDHTNFTPDFHTWFKTLGSSDFSSNVQMANQLSGFHNSLSPKPQAKTR